jgi:predicted AlkP superfamily pyrophosphatase or phosphodiesterase
MRRALIAVVALSAATLPLTAALAATTAPAVKPYPQPTEAERRETIHEFVEDAMRTASERSGDVFFLPRKYNFVTGVGPDKLNTGHVKVNGKVTEITGTGISHGIPWDYDRDLPLIFWGPGFVKPGQVIRTRTSQQDVAPTLAELIGCPRPSHAKGRALSEAFLPTKRKPKVILTMLFDQAGEHYYRVQPGKTPFVDKLKREGTYFANTRVSHVDMETAMGHVAIGTGAFPRDHGLPSNQFWHAGAGDDFYCMEGPVHSQPTHMMSPTVGDWYLKHTQNKALLFSYCWADRAAIGMGGHGSFFEGNKKPWIFYFDQKAGKLTTNPDYYELPSYLTGLTTDAAVEALTGPSRVWMDHPIKGGREVVATPAMPVFDSEVVRRVIEREAFGQDDITDLLYVTLKSTDLAGHLFGQESEEAGAVLAEQDRQFEAIVKALEAKVGRENLVVALTADHGGPPLPELSGGKRLWEKDFLKALNAHFDKTPDGFPVAQYVSGTQIWIDHLQLKASKATLDDVKRFVANYKIDGVPFFETAYTRDEIQAMRRSGVYGF